jgi:hypothetical protein
LVASLASGLDAAPFAELPARPGMPVQSERERTVERLSAIPETRPIPRPSARSRSAPAIGVQALPEAPSGEVLQAHGRQAGLVEFDQDESGSRRALETGLSWEAPAAARACSSCAGATPRRPRAARRVGHHLVEHEIMSAMPRRSFRQPPHAITAAERQTLQSLELWRAGFRPHPSVSAGTAEGRGLA